MKTINSNLLILTLCLLSLLNAQDINAQGKSNKQGFKYHVVASTPVNHLQTGKILGIANYADRIISTKIMKGELPEGLTLFNDGTLAVEHETDKVVPGKYKIKAEFKDKTGKGFTEKIKFEILKPGHEDIGASVRINKPRFTNPELTNHYEVGTIIAQFHDPDGTIADATLVRGGIPAGVMFVHNKNFVVTHPERLKDGEYFCLFFVEDQKGGNTVLAVSLPIGVQLGNRGDQDSVSPFSVSPLQAGE